MIPAHHRQRHGSPDPVFEVNHENLNFPREALPLSRHTKICQSHCTGVKVNTVDEIRAFSRPHHQQIAPIALNGNPRPTYILHPFTLTIQHSRYRLQTRTDRKGQPMQKTNPRPIGGVEIGITLYGAKIRVSR
jgi:hypothetical protein